LVVVAALAVATASCSGGKGGSGAAGTGGGGAGTGGAGGGAGAGGAPTCGGFAISQDGVLDVDLRAVSVTGAVTLAGAALPGETASRGGLLFQSTTDATATATADLGSTGTGSYALRLPPGTYDVSFTPNATACAFAAATAMPCAGGFLKRAVAISADGVLDLDVPVVTVSGKVTLAGVQPPDTNRGQGGLVFALAGGASGASVQLASTGAMTYQTTLLPGHYDVTFAGDVSGCATATPPALPCGSGPLRQGVDISSSGVLDLDVPAVHVSGAVTVNGAALPAAAAARGSLAFSSAAGNVAVATQPFGSTGAASYAVTLLPGRYDVVFVANPALCSGTATPDMPCLGGTIQAARDLSTDGVLDVDIPSIAVTGAITVNGAPLTDATSDRGSLLFARAQGGGGNAPGLGATGAGAYRVRLLTGTYDVSYVPPATLCQATGGGTPPGVPCTTGAVVRGVALTSDGVLDGDLKRIAVTGTVTVRGAAMPSASASRGALTFSAGGAAALTASFGSTGPASYAISLWPGSYDVGLVANAGLCGATLAAPPVPCVGGRLRAAAGLQTDGVLDVDIAAVTISGAVTVNGAALSAETSERGSLSFTRAAAESASTASSVALDLGSTGAFSYAVTLTSGDYVLAHVANPALCPAGGPAPGVPCASQVVRGCP
jgi:hypothetical protein